MIPIVQIQFGWFGVTVKVSEVVFAITFCLKDRKQAITRLAGTVQIHKSHSRDIWYDIFVQETDVRHIIGTSPVFTERNELVALKKRHMIAKAFARFTLKFYIKDFEQT